MQWWGLLVSFEAAGGFLVASLSCLYLAGLVLEVETAARKAGAFSLALVCAALALEAILYLSQPASLAISATRVVAVVAVRSMLFAATALVGLLVWRGARPR